MKKENIENKDEKNMPNGQDSQAEEKMNGEDTAQQETEAKGPESELEKVKGELEEYKDKYLRLYSDFENFRRRTAKEKIEFLKSANENLMEALLPILDDFERANKAFESTENPESFIEGVKLIHNKLFNTLENKGLKPMKSIGEQFDMELHEAITQIPASDESQKGKVVDEVEMGYYLNDKVIRFAKVVIGS